MSGLPFLKNFIGYLRKNNYSEETIYSYERDLKSFSNFLNKDGIQFSEITNVLIEKYKDYISSQERKTAKNKESIKMLSSFSINRMICGLRSYLRYLINIGYKTPASPEILKSVKNKRRQVTNVTLDEQIKLIESPTKFEKNKIVALRNRAMLETIFSTGMRISELINLKKVQIDKTGRIFIMGKGKKERFVYLTHRAQEHLKNYLEIRGIIDSPYLFIPYKGKNVHKKDKKISPNYLQEKIKRYRELLGLNIPVSAHGIRHAFATYLAESGANPAAIQILLGHESLDTTTRYVHASDRYAEKTHKKYHPLKE